MCPESLDIIDLLHYFYPQFFTVIDEVFVFLVCATHIFLRAHTHTHTRIYPPVVLTCLASKWIQ